MYKASFYNHYINVNAKKYVYNLLTTSLAELDEKSFEALKNEDLSKLDSETVIAMKKEGFLVEKNADEALMYKNYYDSVRLGEGAQKLAITLVPSYNCNLACPYCLQGSGKLTKKMSQEDIDAVLKFIYLKLSENESNIPIKTLIIALYGGESMMNKKDLIYFCTETKKLAEKFQISVEYQTTTNLTLLDDSMIDMIEKFQVCLQVTLDGAREQHDKRRITKNGGGTYDLIISNLDKLVKRGLKHLITIRINMDSENIQDAEKVFEEASKYSDDVYFGFLQSFNGYNDEYKEHCVTEEDQSLIVAKKFDEILESKNFTVPQTFGKKSPCSICSRNRFYFDCNLDVYKCELLLNQPECRIGKLNLDGTIELEANYYQQMNFSPFEFEKCKSCKLLPACAGGCPAKKYIELGNKDGNLMLSNCYIDEKSLDYFLTEYIERVQN